MNDFRSPIALVALVAISLGMTPLGTGGFALADTTEGQKTGVLTLLFGSASATTADPSVESSESTEKEVRRIKPLTPLVPLMPFLPKTPRDKARPTATSAEPSVTALAEPSGGGTNLIGNPSLETESVPGIPIGWKKGGYGTNTRILSYPTIGVDGSRGIEAAITAYTSGDAKWFFDDVPVTPGNTYRFTDRYRADVTTYVTLRYAKSDGTFAYPDLGAATPTGSGTFGTYTNEFTVPANVVSVTVFHLLNGVGTLVTDDYALVDISGTPPPPPPPPPGDTNVIPNGNFETIDGSGLPANWKKGGYGTNTRTLSYPVTGPDGTRAAKVTISSYTSGDAKWHFNSIALSPGTYTYTDQYTANVPTHLTAQFKKSDGTYAYKDLGTLPAVTGGSSNVTVTVPPETQNVTIFHLIKSVGTLTIDNVALRPFDVPPPGPKSVFETGAVTISFDDGWKTHLAAAQTLQNAGFKGTFYITSRQLEDYGYGGFLSKADLATIYGMGHEIGGHTRTHPHLTTLTTTQQTNEIAGGRQDLIALGLGPVSTFAYPFGEYTSNTMNIVRNAGFDAARATIDGYITPTSDRYQLERVGMNLDTSVASLKADINAAIANHKWLIINLHRIDNSGDYYSTTPAKFNAIVDYLGQKNARVVTVEEGIASPQ